MVDPGSTRAAEAVARSATQYLHRRYRLTPPLDTAALAATLGGAYAYLRDTEFRGLPPSDWEAAAACAAAAFAALDDPADTHLVPRHDLDTAHIARFVASLDPELPARGGLTGATVDAYQLLVLVSCTRVVELLREHPQFRRLVHQERQRHQDAAAAAVHASTPAPDLVDPLDALTGAPLSVVYTSLTAHGASGDPDAGPPRSVEECLTHRRRVLLLGGPGSGKTTLLQRTALWAARGDLPHELAHWTGRTTLLLTARELTSTEQPIPDSLFSSGPALLLIDGINEIPQRHRERLRHEWLSDLLVTHPETDVVATARPGSVPEWIHDQAFARLELSPMNLAEQARFAAARGSQDLVAALAERPQLRRLAANPLHCALLCALHHHGISLPDTRTRLLAAALSTLPAEQLPLHHPAFREYQAAQRVLSDNSPGELVAWAGGDDRRRDVFTLAVGMAAPPIGAMLVRALLTGGGPAPRDTSIYLVAARALGNIPTPDPQLQGEIVEGLGAAVPPGNQEDADRLALLGEPVLDLLPSADEIPSHALPFAVSLTGAVGGDATLALLHEYAGQSAGIPASTARRLVRALSDLLPSFPPEQFVHEVLHGCEFPPHAPLEAGDTAQLAALSTLRGTFHLTLSGFTHAWEGGLADVAAIDTVEHLTIRQRYCGDPVDLRPLAACRWLKRLDLECHELPVSDRQIIRRLHYAYQAAGRAITPGDRDRATLERVWRSRLAATVRREVELPWWEVFGSADELLDTCGADLSVLPQGVRVTVHGVPTHSGGPHVTHY